MKPTLIINFKNYLEVSSKQTIELAAAAQKIAISTGVEILIAPPLPSLALVAEKIDLPVMCQHLDNKMPGATTGFLVPELAKSYGARGSILNHSEHRLDLDSIKSLVERLRSLDMISIVCAQEAEEVCTISNLSPDFIAIEPPELIGSGKAVSRENPSIVTDSIRAASKSMSKVLCGAGITDANDVKAALELGAKGVLVASGIVKAKSWTERINEIALAMSH